MDYRGLDGYTPMKKLIEKTPIVAEVGSINSITILQNDQKS